MKQKIDEVIEEIFSLSGANKKTPVEQIIKMDVNSIYGKTISKPILFDRKYITNEKLDD
jgi:hypothetical protein